MCLITWQHSVLQCQRSVFYRLFITFTVQEDRWTYFRHHNCSCVPGIALFPLLAIISLTISSISDVRKCSSCAIQQNCMRYAVKCGSASACFTIFKHFNMVCVVTLAWSFCTSGQVYFWFIFKKLTFWDVCYLFQNILYHLRLISPTCLVQPCVCVYHRHVFIAVEWCYIYLLS